MLIGRRICKRLSLFLRGRKGLSSALKAQFLFLFTGKYDDGDLKNDLGEDGALGQVVTNGRLYNWYALDGIAPTGWHVPTESEWNTLATELGGASVAGGKLKEAGTANWNSPNTGATNESGFTALPGGYRYYDDTFGGIGDRGFWWTTTKYEHGGDEFIRFMVMYNDSQVVLSDYDTELPGFSVRLIRDDLTGYTAGETVTDLNGNIYNTIQIGTQVWMVQNWACTKYANGDDIDNVTDNAAWAALEAGAYCDYDNDESNVFGEGETTVRNVITVTLGDDEVSNGRLYNWYALDGIAPDGWHVPSAAEYDELITRLGGVEDAGIKLKHTEGWGDYAGNNESGFGILPAGFRQRTITPPSDFWAIGEYATFWTTTSNIGSAIALFCGQDHRLILLDDGTYEDNYSDFWVGFSVRLIRDDLTGYVEGETLTDPDGNVYDTVRIGDQVWTVQNYASTKYANGDDIANVTDGAAWAALETGAYCNYDNDESYVFEAEEMWTTKHIPATTRAKFTLPATQAYLDADIDEFWTDGECDVVRLVSYDPERTFVQYSDHPPHDIQKIGILKDDAVLTEADENELSRYFRLPWWRFGYFNYFGWWKANMLADEVREWEAEP